MCWTCIKLYSYITDRVLFHGVSSGKGARTVHLNAQTFNTFPKESSTSNIRIRFSLYHINLISIENFKAYLVNWIFYNMEWSGDIMHHLSDERFSYMNVLDEVRLISRWNQWHLNPHERIWTQDKIIRYSSTFIVLWWLLH